MKIRTTLFVLTALVAALVLPVAGEAQQSAKGRSPVDILTHPRLLARYLKLTPEQTTTAQGLYRDLEAVVKPLREARKDLREAYYDELEAANPNACDVGAAALALHANGDQIRAALEDFDEAFSAILTPEQLAKYEALKEAARLLRGDDAED